MISKRQKQEKGRKCGLESELFFTRVILSLLQTEVLLQRKTPGICDIHAIQEGQQVHDTDEGDDVPVDAIHELPLGRMRGTTRGAVIVVGVRGARMVGVVARNHLLALLVIEACARGTLDEAHLDKIGRAQKNALFCERQNDGQKRCEIDK
jgi:hypothetical protein